jgi:hypothetical protein
MCHSRGDRLSRLAYSRTTRSSHGDVDTHGPSWACYTCYTLTDTPAMRQIGISLIWADRQARSSNP